MSSEQEARRLRFLCTNDDGIHAPGLALLSEVAGRLGDVFVVAPDRQRSGSSHSLTLNSPLRATPVGENRLSLDGTPTDCVLVAVNLLCEQDPHFVLSGVNHGANMGEDVLYSGTVAAAMEGTILGIPAIAVSFVGRDDELLRGYADLLERLLVHLVRREDFPDETFFNVNLPDVPAEDVQGYRITTLGRRKYSDSLRRDQDPAGHEFFWIGGGTTRWKGRPDSDFRAVESGCISITPMHLDLTNFELIEEVSRWPLKP
jgi:5'-nucleotidase